MTPSLVRTRLGAALKMMHIMPKMESAGEGLFTRVNQSHPDYAKPLASEITWQERESRLGMHIRQFLGWSTCADLIERAELEESFLYDLVIRIRDNALVVQPLVLAQAIFVESPYDAFVKDCAEWGGYNDKFMIVKRAHMHSTFRGHVSSLLTSAGSFRNTEQLLKLKLDSRQVRVLRLPANVLPVVDARCRGTSYCVVPDNKDCHPPGYINKDTNCSSPMTEGLRASVRAYTVPQFSSPGVNATAVGWIL
eukprot:CAMPEP_0185173576 /NCGR_PEP_ID=MMETSP1139-20130426/23700_1 /TAXON_ID=298111 /ORGANISM="Pavlova sp., Strain CCMP459" /LENGTH=250 /DNA_ID=CAMNT_0027739273 /DNA_START=377 /DNA_END=1129 /DNA_ORIENTATION=+